MFLDFYDASVHTEPSIRRAQNQGGTAGVPKKCSTSNVPLSDNSADIIFVIFAAHEIRNDSERAGFFRELARVIGASGRIVVTEHLLRRTKFTCL